MNMQIRRRWVLFAGTLLWLLLWWVTPGPAVASAVDGSSSTGQTRVTVEVQPPVKPSPKPGKLPQTSGTDIPVVPLVIGGVALIALGLLLLRRSASR
jgi:LPXTG-motif cell wall-anchored protein